GPSRPAIGSTSQARLISRSGTNAPTARPETPTAIPAGPSAIDGFRARRSAARGGGAGEEVEHCHSDRDAARNLVGDQGLRTRRDVWRDLDALVHRPRMHDERLGTSKSKPFAGQTETRRVFAQRRQEARGHSL